MFFTRKKSNSPISAKTRNNIAIYAFVILMAVVVFDNLRLRNKQNSQHSDAQITAANSSNPDFAKFDSKTFRVIYIVDGDTLDINIPDGKYPKTRIRLLGIDTPETKNPRMKQPMHYGQEATNFVKHLAFNKNITVHLDTVSPTRDRYGRLLAYLQLEDGTNINEQIVKQGYGYADPRFANSKMKSFMKAQDTAIKSKVGLWQNIQPNQLPSWFAKEYPEIFKNLSNHPLAANSE